MIRSQHESRCTRTIFVYVAINDLLKTLNKLDLYVNEYEQASHVLCNDVWQEMDWQHGANALINVFNKP